MVTRKLYVCARVCLVVLLGALQQWMHVTIHEYMDACGNLINE